MKKYYVYIMKEEKLPGEPGPAFLKIGRSWSPYERLKSIQYANPRQLTLEVVFGPFSLEQSKHMERELQRIGRRHRFNGEWFTDGLLNDFDPGDIDMEQHFWHLGECRNDIDVELMVDAQD